MAQTIITPIEYVNAQGLDANSPIFDLWPKAIDLFNSKLTKDIKKRIDLDTFQRRSFSDFLGDAIEARDRAERGSNPWTSRLKKIVSQINHYAIAGDLIIQQHTEYTALVWGAFRFLLLLAAEESATLEKLTEALESIVPIMFRADQYAELFSHSSDPNAEQIFQSLQDNLVRLYAEVLNFLVRATRFFEKGTWRRIFSAGFSPYNTKFQKILDEIYRCDGEVEKHIGVIRSAAEKRQQEYQNGVWLHHADFAMDLRQLQGSCVAGTCEWFLHSDVYAKWRQSSLTQNPNLLWIHGKPGSGKSTLAGQILKDAQSLPEFVFLFVFCRSGEESKDDLVSILRNLVFQLVEKSPRQYLLHQMVQAVRFNDKTVRAQSGELLWALLQRMLERNGNVCCILDGIDECRASVRERECFFDQLTKTFTLQGSSAKLLVTSRLDPSELGVNRSRWECMQIQSCDVRDDIENFAISEIRRIQVLNTHPKKQDILRVLVDNSDGMILWTALMIKELEERPWVAENVLREPPQGLAEVYRVILDRVMRTASPKRILYALQLVLAADRPLHLGAFALGLAVMEGLRCHEDYNFLDPTAEGRVITRLWSLTYRAQERWGEAEKLQVEALDTWKRILGAEHPSTLASMSSLAWTYWNLERWREAEELELKVIETGKRVLGPEHPETFVNLRYLASMYREQQRLKEAEELLLKIVEIGERVFGLEHPNTLACINNLASTYRIQGRHEEAEELHFEAAEIGKRVLGQDHPLTLAIMHELASTYESQGRYKEAEELGINVLEARKRVLGTEHTSTLMSMHNLAYVLKSQDRDEDAINLMEKVERLQEELLGPDHFLTKKSKQVLYRWRIPAAAASKDPLHCLHLSDLSDSVS